jgi:LmbE family N-acetylglucosaminyl deacetylase
MSKRILAIHAHPDDCEFFAGGTLALLAGRGHSITIVTMTPGDCGSAEHDPDEIAAIRRREAAAAAQLIGATYLCAEFRDLSIFNDDSSRRHVVELLRRTRPDIVIMSSGDDYHCDHEATHLLVRDACFAAPAPNYSTNAVGSKAPPLNAIPHLYLMDSVGGVGRSGAPILPDFVVNVGPTFEEKKAMLLKHESQREWLRKHHGMDNYIIMMEDWTRACGQRAGIELGEGFRIYKGHPYPQTPALEDLLTGDVVMPGNELHQAP